MRPYPYRPPGDWVLFLDPWTGRSVRSDGRASGGVPTRGGWLPTGTMLTIAAGEGCRRVFLTGRKPKDQGWLDEPAAGYVPAGHFYQLRDPCGRWADRFGHVIEFRRVASWLGEGDYTPQQARDAMAALHFLLTRSTGGRVGVLSSPAATGQSLWASTLRDGQCDEQVSDDIGDLIRSTSPQHREEVIGACYGGCTDHLEQSSGRLHGLSYVDGVFMYAACVRELGTAPAVMMLDNDARKHWAGLPVSAAGLRQGRARYRIHGQVPAGWLAPGLLPVKHPNGRNWHYPNRAGVEFDTWVDAAELALAESHGWPFTIKAGLIFTEGNRPADTFGEKMVRLRASVADADRLGELVAAGLRSMFIRTVGSWHSRGRERTYVAPAGQDLPADVTDWETRPDGSRVYVRQVELTGNAAAFMRPELSSQVWARARVKVARRMLAGDGTQLPEPSGVVGVWGDALYLSGQAVDGGTEPGQFRLKGFLPGSIVRPKSISDLLKLRARMGDE